MLVLTRKSNESIKLGDEITITVVEVRGNSVRIGITAPDNMRIYRKELYDRISDENLLAMKTGIDDIGKIREVLKKND
jgi:carbon storage regulator